MGPDDSFADLMRRLSEGQQSAASELYERFRGPLSRRASHHLDPLARAKLDPEDVLQSAFRSFFTRFAAGQFEDLGRWNHLWHLLATITRRKCIDRNRHFRSEARDVSRERNSESAAHGLQSIAARDSAPPEAAAFAETLALLFAKFEKRNQQILALWLAGMSPLEISDQIGCTERTVFRILERAEDLLCRML